jgi:hypothetical protein
VPVGIFSLFRSTSLLGLLLLNLCLMSIMLPLSCQYLDRHTSCWNTSLMTFFLI